MGGRSGINSGALTEDRALTSVLTIDELRGRCYVNSKQGRRA